MAFGFARPGLMFENRSLPTNQFLPTDQNLPIKKTPYPVPTQTEGKRYPTSLPEAYPKSIEQAFSDYGSLMSMYRDALNKITQASQVPEIQLPSIQLPTFQLPNVQLPTPQQVDFSGLISRYEDILKEPLFKYGPLRPGEEDTLNRITPLVYQRGPEMAAAFEILKNLAETGGFSEENISDIRARAISPIRSIYANAEQELARQRALQGGYSPNYGAVTSRMARELADIIGEKTTGVNAEIARMVAEGKQRAAPEYAARAQAETELINRIAQQNLENKIRAMQLEEERRFGALSGLSGLRRAQQEFGLSLAGLQQQGALSQQQAALEQARLLQQAALEQARLQQEGALERARLQQQAGQFQTGSIADLLRGMTSLYGTNPALAETFGRQVLGAIPYDTGPRINYSGGISVNRPTYGLGLRAFGG